MTPTCSQNLEANTNLYDDHGLGSEQGLRQSEHQEQHCSSQAQCLYFVKEHSFMKIPGMIIK